METSYKQQSAAIAALKKKRLAADIARRQVSTILNGCWRLGLALRDGAASEELAEAYGEEAYAAICALWVDFETSVHRIQKGVLYGLNAEAQARVDAILGKKGGEQ